MDSRGKAWTEAQIELLKNNYMQLEYKDIAEMLGRSEGAIRNKIYEMKLPRKEAECWSDSDIQRLKDYYQANDIVNMEDLESIFPERHKTNICRKARELCLTDQTRKSSDETRIKNSEASKKWIAERGHPKGMLGLHHTKETKAVISRNSKEMWADPNSYLNSEEHRQMLSDNAIKNNLSGKGRIRYSKGKMGKREDLGGLFVRSSWEANYARYLNWLISVGEIKKWEYEPDVFWFEEIKRGTRSYTPDFKIHLNDGNVEYHEVKGWMDSKSKTKLNRMKRYYPNTKIVLIDENVYKIIQKSVKGLIENWE